MAVRRMLVAGRYRLHEPVGSGGMGRVWLARDEMLDRDVAVKEFVPPDWMTGEEKDRLRDRTLREARSAARLNHPHVVGIYDVVHADGLPWIVMEYVPSRSLHQVIGEDGPFDPVAAARIGLDVLSALRAAHDAGVLHRDIKPHNVLIGPRGRVVLTDFGLATFVDDGAVTGPGLVVGSPQYVSPERARDGASTRESDLWSFGATLYAAVEGRSPYLRESAMATLMALALEPPDPHALAGPLAPVLNGLLQRDPAARLTAEEAEHRLRAIVAGHAPAGPAPAAGYPAGGRAPVPPPRRPALGGAAAGEGAMAAVVSREIEPAPEPTPAAASAIPAQRKPESAPGPAPRTPRRRWLVTGALAVVLLAGGGLAVHRLAGDDDSGGTGAGAPIPPPPSAVTSPAPSASQATAPAGGFNPVACDRPMTGARRTPQPGAPTTLSDKALLPGYSVFDGGAWRIAVPDGWLYQRVGSTWCFRDPYSLRVLSVDPDRKPSGDPVQACRVEANRLQRSGAVPKYRQLSLTADRFADKAADWEFTYQAQVTGTPLAMHARTRWFASGGGAYAIGWITRDSEWTGSSPDFVMMLVTFRGE